MGAGGVVQKDDVLDLLSRLVDKSLVVAEPTPGEEGVARYRMLEPVRQYVRERLEESGEAQQARKRHAEYYLALAEEAEPKLVGAEQTQTRWLERLETEHDNFRAALRWLLEKREAELALRLVGALGEFWQMRGHLRDGQGWLEAALVIEGGDKLPARLKALNYTGRIAWNRLDFERTTAASQELLALSRESGDKANVAAALHHLGMVAIHDQMKAEKARALFEESLRIRRELGDEFGTCKLLQRLGLISVVQRDFGQARVLYEECLALSQKTGNEMSALNTRWLGGLVYLGLGDHERVEQVCEEGIGLARRIGNWRLTALILYVLAASIAQRGRPVRAGRLWGAAESILDSLGLGLGPAERYHYGPYIAAAPEQLDEAVWEAAWAEGKAMTPEEALDYALSSKEEAAPPTVSAPRGPTTDESLHTLTRRQQEIMRLVARGLTNRRIAEELVVSERTVETHVSRILKKLGFRSRAQLAAWAAQPPSE